jgi:predicted DNA-binding transcriptional regulator AlpA
MNHLARPLLDINEMAADLKIPKSWLYSKTRQQGENSIPVLRVGKYLRFDPVEVREWLRLLNSKR